MYKSMQDLTYVQINRKPLSGRSMNQKPSPIRSYGRQDALCVQLSPALPDLSKCKCSNFKHPTYRPRPLLNGDTRNGLVITIKSTKNRHEQVAKSPYIRTLPKRSSARGRECRCRRYSYFATYPMAAITPTSIRYKLFFPHCMAHTFLCGICGAHLGVSSVLHWLPPVQSHF